MNFKTDTGYQYAWCITIPKYIIWWQNGGSLMVKLDITFSLVFRKL